MRKRVIVVADNSLIVEAIRSGLHESGAFELLGYTDAYNATTRLISGAGADLVLLDEADESETAIALIRSIRDELEHVTVIILTVRMEGDWLTRAFDAGATGAISKAVHPSALATLVREAISGHIVHPLTSVGGESKSEREVIPEQCALTDRELQILQLVAAGATNGEIARQLWITQQTVKFHVSNIYRKLDVANRTEACHYAHVNGLVTSAHSPRLGVVASSDGPARRGGPRASGGRHTVVDPGAHRSGVEIRAARVSASGE
jgi:DNA-binding NarL/FixJ family response regulator